jgi:hypothetical protein
MVQRDQYLLVVAQAWHGIDLQHPCALAQGVAQSQQSPAVQPVRVEIVGGLLVELKP